MPDDMELENRMAKMDPATKENAEKLGHPSAFTCPECEGAPVGDSRPGTPALPVPGGTRLRPADVR